MNIYLFSFVKLIITYTWENFDIFVCVYVTQPLIISEVFSIYPLFFLIQCNMQMIVLWPSFPLHFLILFHVLLTRTFRRMLNCSKRKSCIGDSGLCCLVSDLIGLLLEFIIFLLILPVTVFPIFYCEIFIQ